LVKRVLVGSEASYLNTGYASYGRELIKRLIDTGKYEVAEISCYGAADDERRREIPWKNYPIAPSRNDPEKVRQIYGSNPANQFGAWRFERICLDFKPDAVLMQKDPWMDSWIKHSPYRPYFSWIWASTVDSAPQSPEWINQFADADYFYTLSEWAEGVIKEQAGDSVNLIGSVTMCAADEFKPVPNKAVHKLSMGLDPEYKIIGTVMRNQRRKLFPDLFEAFSKYLKATGDEKTYLYCHTSYPDNGWDIPQLMLRNEISSRVLFSYACEACGALSICRFSDTVKQCKKCKHYASKMSNVSTGATTEDLAKIYNLFDVYVQYSNSEGMGIGQLEAAACGIHVMSTDYSAMESIVRKVDGYPIPVRAKTLELETGCYRAIPDIDAVAKYWQEFLSLPEEKRDELGKRAREAYVANFQWDKVVDKWMQSIDACPKGQWDLPLRQINLPAEDKMPKVRNNYEFLEWALKTYIPYSRLEGSFELNCILRDMNFQSHRPNPCGYFYSENSYFDRVNFVPFSAQNVIELFRGKAEVFNFWENARVGNVKLHNEDWLND
jgi:glycosyltransferase involved in cell wall biosynthesis